MRRDDEHINRRVLEMKIEGVRARGEKTLVRLRCQKHEEELGEYWHKRQKKVEKGGRECRPPLDKEKEEEDCTEEFDQPDVAFIQNACIDL